ncbi:unnamed protein product [Mytilus coruscus]|uniref:Integrase catalytic domain-containing protein n=1 Tax=Mytilus coruscus TaxID=42192 RepID=A0A6J8C0K1_MYTCO|nr:unnamed protein product [Mytilus coruscus]
MGKKRIKNVRCCRKSRCASHSTVTPREADIDFKSSLDRNFMHLDIENSSVKCLMDSGASISLHVGRFKHGTSVILEPKGNLFIEHQVAGGKTVSTVLRGMASYRLLNLTNSWIYIPRETKVAKAETVHSNHVTAFTDRSLVSINSLTDFNSDKTCSEISDLGFNLDNSELTVEQKQQIQNFLIKNRDIFAKDLSELGQTNLHCHTIYTGNAKPISAAPYRQSPQMRRELDKQLDEMQRYNIIEESTSPWHSPVILVKKRNGSIRKKCKFATRKIKYLGHIISKDGIRVNPKNTERVENLRRLTNAKQVKSFLGMANYYRKFVKDYTYIAAPLSKLLKKDQRFQWTPECDNAFQNLKDRLTSASILSFLHLDKPFILSTDSSEFSNGYILSQIQNGLEHVIAYGGNQELTVFSDNVSVKYLQKYCQGRLGRWSLLLQGYNFKILHRAGSKNPADCLSRQNHSETNNSASIDSSELAEQLMSIDINNFTETTFIYKGENEEAVISSLQSVTINDIHLTNLAEEQEKCKDFADMIMYKQSGKVPKDPDLARTVVAEFFNFELEDRIFKHFYSKRGKRVPKDERLVKQIAVPRDLRDSILKACHDCILGGGHQSFDRSYAAIHNKYFWLSMYIDVNQTLLSDCGCNFVSNLVKALSELFNIKRHLTSSYHLQTNGACERMNSVILRALHSYTQDQRDDWYDVLPGILMAYRATPATQSTDYSPFFLLYGREMTLPIDTALIPKDRLVQDHKIFLSRILQNLETSKKNSC